MALVRDGRLRAVLDFGATGFGDPATDLNPAWSIFSQDSRDGFRDLVGADDDTWHRDAHRPRQHKAEFIRPADVLPALASVHVFYFGEFRRIPGRDSSQRL